MDNRPIELVLQDESHIEKPESKALRLRARNIVQASSSELLDALLDLLTSVIKPLFSESSHPKLTSTGRKVLVNNSLPGSITDRFSSFELEDGTNRPLWKNGWTPQLLLHILGKYTEIGNADKQKKTIEAHFYLLVPPILKQLDDMQIAYKASGCRCLEALCTFLLKVKSTILKQSGLMDVFVDALKNDFSMLPTLTPEDESLTLYEALYPAYRSLVKTHSEGMNERRSSSIKTSASQAGLDDSKRQSYLTLLLRHQLLHALVHLSTATGGGSTTSVPLSTFLFSQISWVVSDMGLSAVVHLQTILPLLRNVLVDPFATSAPSMLLETIKALQEIVQVCWPRIKEKWWGECLRAIVTCWLNVCDDEADLPSRKDVSRDLTLGKVKQQLQITACLLEDVVGRELGKATEDLIAEAQGLTGLFTLPTRPTISKPQARALISEIEA